MSNSNEPDRSNPGPEPEARAHAPGTLEVRQLSYTRYEDAWKLQKELVAERIAGKIGDVLILTEHEDVVTVGRGTKREAWPQVDFPVVEVERGGEATYHGPGQLVAYPIFELPPGRRDLHRYLRDLEEVVIRCLAEVEVSGSRRAGATGVWIGDQKVCSIGVSAKQWVTYHGFALNLRSNLNAFRNFKPCGFDPGVMTNLDQHTDLPPGSLLFQVLVVKHVCEVFGLELPPAPKVVDPGPGEWDPNNLPILPS